MQPLAVCLHIQKKRMVSPLRFHPTMIQSNPAQRPESLPFISTEIMKHQIRNCAEEEHIYVLWAGMASSRQGIVAE